MHRKLLRILIFTTLGAGVFIGLGCLGLLLMALPEPGHLDRKGRLVAVDQTAQYRLPDSEVREYRLSSDTGLEVEIALRVPDMALDHRPLLLMMGGQETGRAAVQVIPDTRGVAVAAISYPFGTVPHRQKLGLAVALPRIQQGIFETPAAALLALDFLLGPELGLDPGQVELAGISFGAYLAAVPAALDPRFERLWLIHGGAAVADTLDHMLQRHVDSGTIRRQLASYLATVVGARHLGPERWVARVSPRPLVVVNAAADDALPEVSTRALRAALQEPFEILWTPGQHVHPKRPEVIAAITDLMFSRIAGLTGTGHRPARMLTGLQ